MSNYRRNYNPDFAMLLSIRDQLPAETEAERKARLAREAHREAAKLGFRNVSRSTRYVADSLSQAARDLANSER